MMIINQTKPVSACPTHDMVDMDTVDLDMSDMDIADMDMVGNGMDMDIVETGPLVHYWVQHAKCT